jgi:putative thioredoxin
MGETAVSQSTDQSSSWIVDADEATFEQAVIERSREMLVVVDFWATWCQPCRLLGPILEKLAREYDGKFLLVKADTDKMPSVASGFGVESIPAVYALRDGKMLDFFVGLMGEDQIRAWIDRLLPSPGEQLVAEARKLETPDPAAAEAKYREALQREPNLAAARIGLASFKLSQGQTEEARTLIEDLEKRGYLEPEAERLKAQLHLASSGSAPADLESLAARAKANPQDFAAALAWAEALAAQGQYEQALTTALRLVESGKREFVEPARALMVDVFRMLGDDNPLTTEYRRRLSTALY